MIMRRIGRRITEHPYAVLLAIFLITCGAVLEITINPMEEKFDNEDFMPDLEVTEAWNDYQEVFTPSYSFVVLVKDPDGDLLTRQDFLDIIYLGDNITGEDTFKKWKADAMGTKNPDSPPLALHTMDGIVQQAEGIKQAGFLYSSLLPKVSGLEDTAANFTGELAKVALNSTRDVNSTASELDGELEELLGGLAVPGSGGNAGAGAGSPREFIASMESDGELKNKIREVLSYDITDPAIMNGTFISQQFGAAGSGTVAELEDSMEAADHALGQDNISQGSRDILETLKDELNDTKKALQGYVDSSAMTSNPSIVGYVMQTYNMASFSLVNYLTEDLDPASETPTAKGALLMVSLNYTLNFMAKDDADRLYNIETNLTEVVEEADGGSDMDIHSLGGETLDRRINEASMDSMAILLPLAFGLVVFILFLVYRSFWDIVINLIGLVLAVIWMYGFGSLMGFYSNPMLTAVPVLIVGLGIDYGIHLTMRYREEIKKGEKVKKAIATMTASVGVALVLATFTTVLAFLSNVVSPVGILAQFGAMAAFGIFASFVIMLTFLSSVKRLIDLPKARKGKKLWGKYREGDRVEPGASPGIIRGVANRITRISVMTGKRPAVVMIIIILITGGMGYAATKNSVTFDINDFLPEGLQETEDINYLMNEFALFSEGFSGQGDQGIIMVYGDLTQPGLLREMHDVVENAGESDSGLIKKEGEGSQDVKVSYILTSLRDMAVNLGSLNPDSAFYSEYTSVFDEETGEPLPNATSAGIREVYDMFFDDYAPLARMVLYREDDDYRMATISFTVITPSHQDKWDLYDELEDLSGPLKEQDTRGAEDVKVTGTSILTAVIVDSISDSQVTSLVVTIVISLIALTIVFFVEKRSLVLGGAATIPVIFCMLWILGTMQLVGIPLNVLTITVAALTVGLGITYGIHFTHRFIEDLENTKEPLPALKLTAKNTGFALMGAAFTTIGGFGLLMFALLPPLKQFGQVTALAILFSFLSSMTVLPTLLVLWTRGRRKWRERGGR